MTKHRKRSEKSRVLRWLAPSAFAAFLASAASCNQSPGTTDPCPGGICIGNPDGGGDGGSTVCAENWVCTPWATAAAGSNAGTRTCTDKNACGTTKFKPAEAATLPALDLEFYKCRVEPILDLKCAQLACHGTETDRALRVYARGRLRNAETVTETGCLSAGTQVQLVPRCVGSIECICWTGSHTATEWRKNFDAARGFALDANNQRIAAGQEDASELIAQPIVGGKAHAGVHLFKSGDADHMTIKQWLSGTALGMTCNTIN